MNREQEHNDLLQELLFTPSALDDVLSKAQAREKRRNIIRKSIAIPWITAASILIVFTTMVNISPAFASSMEHIPGLRALAEAVSFSPSLTMVIEQELVQQNRQEQTVEDAVTIRLEYVIVDGYQLHIFYTLHPLIHANSVDTKYAISFGGYGTDENHEICMEISGLGTMDPNRDGIADGEIHSVYLMFDGPVPPVVIWEGDVRDQGADNVFPGRTIGQYSFTIVIDETLTGQEIFDVNQDFILEGQRFSLKARGSLW